MQAAKKIYGKGSYRAKRIREIGQYWLDNESLPISLQGCHQKTKSLIDDEDIIAASLAFIRESNGKTTPRQYKDYVNKTLFLQLNLPHKTISTKTSGIWL